MPATDLIILNSCTLFRVKSFAPTGLSKVSLQIVVPDVSFRAGFHKKATHRPGGYYVSLGFTNTRSVKLD